MKRVVFILGMILLLIGYSNAQDQKEFGKKVAEGNTNTLFGKYIVEVNNKPVIIDGEEVTSYKISYEKSPISIIVLVDKEKKCKNYIVVSESLSLMYTCNGKYFGVNRIDDKYKKDGYVTDDKNLDKTNYFHQKLLAQGQQEELSATTLIASYFPELIKK
jgi:hypothetical protein